MVNISIKRLDTSLPLPQYKTVGSAGVDLYASLPHGDLRLPAKARVVVPTGIAVQLPSDLELQVRPRSGLALKHGITVLNSPGTVDSDYRGEVGVILFNTGDSSFIIKHGDRIAQGVFTNVYHVVLHEVDELESTERGGNGFGSTGV